MIATLLIYYQSTFGFAMIKSVKQRFLLRVPWYLRASALSFAWSTFWDTAWEKMETLAMSWAFFDPGSFKELQRRFFEDFASFLTADEPF